eukprot:scaffold170769_cov28-Tisochrysis_lutea.AAC.13
MRPIGMLTHAAVQAPRETARPAWGIWQPATSARSNLRNVSIPVLASASGKCIRKYDSCLNHSRWGAGNGLASPPANNGNRRCCRADAERKASKTS